MVGRVSSTAVLLLCIDFDLFVWVKVRPTSHAHNDGDGKADWKPVDMDGDGIADDDMRDSPNVPVAVDQVLGLVLQGWQGTVASIERNLMAVYQVMTICPSHRTRPL